MANDTKYGYLISPAPQFLDTNGKPLSGGRLKVYIAGTTTKATTYSDWNLTKNTWPIVLDAMGTCQVIVSSAELYKFVLESAEGEEPLVTRDNVAVAYANVDITGIGSEVVNSDGSVEVTATTDPDTGRTTYDVSVKDTVQDLEGLIEDEAERATAAEKAAKTEVVAGDNITVTKTVGADGQDVYTIDGEDGENLVDEVIAAALNDLNARIESLENMENFDDIVAETVNTQEFPLVGGKSMVLFGSSAPDSAPSYEGQLYLDLTNKNLYFSVGQSSASDWVLAKKKQSAVTLNGSTIKTVTRIAQDANGNMSATFEDIRSASTTQKGVVQLSDSTASASSETAATSAAVKQAYDLAASKQETITWMTDAEALLLWTDAWNAAT